MKHAPLLTCLVLALASGARSAAADPAARPAAAAPASTSYRLDVQVTSGKAVAARFAMVVLEDQPARYVSSSGDVIDVRAGRPTAAGVPFEIDWTLRGGDATRRTAERVVLVPDHRIALDRGIAKLDLELRAHLRDRPFWVPARH